MWARSMITPPRRRASSDTVVFSPTTVPGPTDAPALMRVLAPINTGGRSRAVGSIDTSSPTQTLGLNSNPGMSRLDPPVERVLLGL